MNNAQMFSGVQDLNEHKLRSEAAIQSINDERLKLQSEVPLLSAQLQEERKRGDELTVERDRLEVCTCFWSVQQCLSK